MIRKYNGEDLLKVLIYYQQDFELDKSEFNIICPFHDDINPSMKISLSEGSYFCFGCACYGNALDFVKQAQPELNELHCAIVLEKIIRSKKVGNIKVRYKKKKRKNNKQSMNESYDYYYGLKTVDWYNVKTEEEKEVLQYMKSRGFDERALTIGKCKASYNKAYRAIFPILDNGEFKGYNCRTTNKLVEKQRKYLLSDGFYKRDTLCGTYKENSIVWICEGHLDWLNLKAKGHIKNIVALFGWHLSDMQLKKLQDKNIKTVVSALDNDASGEKGTKLLEKYFDVIRVDFPEGVKDVGEMSQAQIDRMKRKVMNEIRNKTNL